VLAMQHMQCRNVGCSGVSSDVLVTMTVITHVWFSTQANVPYLPLHYVHGMCIYIVTCHCIMLWSHAILL